MSFFDRIGTKVKPIQDFLQYKECPKCCEQMYLARWFSMWVCEKCDITIDFTKEEIKTINKHERQRGLHQTGKKFGVKQ